MDVLQAVGLYLSVFCISQKIKSPNYEIFHTLLVTIAWSSSDNKQYITYFQFYGYVFT